MIINFLVFIFYIVIIDEVFAVTASGPRESSWSVYCTEDEIMPCLGDEFSVAWIEDQSNVILNILFVRTWYLNVCTLFLYILIY